MTDNTIPEWLQFDDNSIPTEEKNKKAWARLSKMNLGGKRITLANCGGDMYEIDATIEQVIPVLGMGVILKITDAKLIDQQERVSPENLLEARYIFLDTSEPPEFRNTNILLPSGGVCVDEKWEIVLGGILTTGFIYI